MRIFVCVTAAGGEPLPYNTALVGFPTKRRGGVTPPECNEHPLRHGYVSSRRAGACSRRCNKFPLRYGKPISSTVYTSLPYEGRVGWGVYVYEDANSGFVCFATFGLCGNTKAPSLYPPLKGGAIYLGLW